MPFSCTAVGNPVMAKDKGKIVVKSLKKRKKDSLGVIRGFSDALNTHSGSVFFYDSWQPCYDKKKKKNSCKKFEKAKKGFAWDQHGVFGRAEHEFNCHFLVQQLTTLFGKR